jgi:hypothetical protein
VALLPYSLAGDRIPVEYCSDESGNLLLTDQRGIPRPQGLACDIGAFEAQPPQVVSYWKRQCSQEGARDIGPEEIRHLIANIADQSSAFPECFPVECETFWTTGKRDEARVSAVREVLALWLNVVSGRLPRSSHISLPQLATARTVLEAIHQVEATICNPSASRSDLADARDIADALNSGEGIRQ